MDTDLRPVRVLNEKRDGANPRKIALLILDEYFRKKRSLKDIINFYFKEHRLSGLDKRFIFNIVKGTVRYYLKIDFLLSFFSDKKIKDIEFTVLNILRMGIFQLMYMDKVPPYSIVNESVELTKKNVTLSSSKFVNAVLRKVSQVPNINSFVKEKIEKLTGDETGRISIDYSYPLWLVKYWFDLYGKEKTALICKSLNENPHIYLRFNKNKITAGELTGEINIIPVDIGKLSSGISRMLDGVIEVSSVQDITGTDAYRKGLVSVQDLSSQIAVKCFLSPEKGEKVLDTCAAPGGKTAYIAELVGSYGEVVSVDISGKRLKVLQDNLDRLNIKNVRIIEADTAKPDFLEGNRDIKENKVSKNERAPAGYTGYFDKILVDAPCSAFGTISKNPDAKYNKMMKDIIRLSEMSYKIMVNCDRYLKTGGKIVFYTCTLSTIENQQVIGKFLGEFKDKYRMERSSISLELISFSGQLKNDASLREEACFEIMPYYFGSEAGFVCSILKNS